jgi:hypothetical protein
MGRSHPRPDLRHGAFTLAALLAVFLQAFIVQPHVHASAPFAPAYERTANSDATSGAVHASAAIDHQQGCIVCQALAANGSAALPDTACVADQTNASCETAALKLRQAPAPPAHPWRSRAPPLALSA